MGSWRWAYVDCTATGGQAAGPTGSLQYLTGSNASSGSAKLLYYTASVGDLAASTMVLTGTLIVSGSLTASNYHIKNITEIDGTGSTFFGDSNDDIHVRTGSLLVGASGAGSNYVLSASTYSSQTFIKGLGVNYTGVSATHHTTSTSTYIVGVTNVTDVEVRIHSASKCAAGAIILIKDEVASRGAYNITLTASHLETIDGGGTYVLTGTMPAISLYSNGSNWFVF
jgi:hypothetical protein